MSNYLENKLIDALFRAVAYSPPGTLYIGLWTAALDDTSTGSTAGEVSGGSYARQSIVSGNTTWSATDGAGSNITPSAGTSGTTDNLNAITFPTATGSWGTVTYVAILDAAAVGNILFWGALTVSKTVSSGDVFQFLAQSLSVQIDN